MKENHAGKSGHKKRHEKVNLENESPLKKHHQHHSVGQENNEKTPTAALSAKKQGGKENGGGGALGVRRRKNERAQAHAVSANKKEKAETATKETVETF